MFSQKKQSQKAPLQTIIDDLKDGFCTIELNGDFLYLNSVARELFEINSEYNLINLYHDIIREKKHIDFIQKELDESGFIKDYEIDTYTVSNRKFPIIISLSNINDPHENIVGSSVLIKDMTYIKKVQQQLLQAQKMESIGMLASGIAHEFNNILTGIIPNAELIKMTISPDSQNYTRANSIQKSALRAADIVKKLLSFSRDDDTKDKEHSNLIVIANETVDILRKLFDKNVNIESSIPNDLFHVKIDSTRLQQIIMNLFINAKDAMNGSGVIKIVAENFVIKNTINSSYDLPEGKYVRLIISDTGQGIPERHLNRIFDPFFTTKEQGKGTGLGLSIVYGIINSVNGKIEVKSKIGSGTTFLICFPATESKSDETLLDFQTNFDDKDQTILLIDDEPIIRDMSRDMLTTIGYNVILSDNGAEGIRIFKEQSKKIDLIILDILMPEMNGVTCFKKLKEINKNVKVIISSGANELEKKQKLKELGIVGYLEKPYSLKEIADTIENALSKS